MTALLSFHIRSIFAVHVPEAWNSLLDVHYCLCSLTIGFNWMCDDAFVNNWLCVTAPFIWEKRMNIAVFPPLLKCRYEAKIGQCAVFSIKYNLRFCYYSHKCVIIMLVKQNMWVKLLLEILEMWLLKNKPSEDSEMLPVNICEMMGMCQSFGTTRCDAAWSRVSEVWHWCWVIRHSTQLVSQSFHTNLGNYFFFFYGRFVHQNIVMIQ